MKKITTQELERVWNLPGYNGYYDITEDGPSQKNFKGGCAVCKLRFLDKSFKVDWSTNIGKLGLQHDYALRYAGVKEYCVTPEQQQIHINYFKKVLQLAVQEGIIEIEDEAAKEFLGESISRDMFGVPKEIKV